MERSYGLIHDTHDERDFLYSSIASTGLPKNVNLWNERISIRDQSYLGSCTAFALSYIRLYWLMKRINTKFSFDPFSPLYLYWHERDLEGDVDADRGASLRSGMKILHDFGLAFEKDCPYIPALYKEHPSQRAETFASSFRIASYHRISGIEQLKQALADGFPVVSGVSIYSSFESQAVADSGVVPMPDLAKERCLGGHALAIFEYNDDTQLVTGPNSWGPKWGDNGLYHMPYAMFEDYTYVKDMWVMKDL